MDSEQGRFEGGPVGRVLRAQDRSWAMDCPSGSID